MFDEIGKTQFEAITMQLPSTLIAHEIRNYSYSNECFEVHYITHSAILPNTCGDLILKSFLISPAYLPRECAGPVKAWVGIVLEWSHSRFYYAGII